MFTTDMDDVLSAFFGGGMESMRRAGPRGPRKGRDATHTLPVTLEDLYNGRSVTVQNERTVACTQCLGTGLKSGRARNSAVCPLCRGSGSRMMVRQMGMMLQQMRTVCEGCQGSGQRIDPKDRCTRCLGQKTEVADGTVEVMIERGMQNGDRLPFAGMASVEGGATVPGDLIIVLQQVKHDKFVRKDCNLYVRHRITLAEALCGFQFKLVHLDGRELLVRRSRGEITAPGSMYSIVGEGMPVLRQRGKFGDLILEFEVDYPDRLDEEQVALLRTSLPPPPSVDVPSNEEGGGDTCHLQRESLDHLRDEIAKEEEEEGGNDAEGERPSVGCAQA